MRDERRGTRTGGPRGWPLAGGLALAGLGTLLNKGLDQGDVGRILVILGAVIALVAVWRPWWYDRPGRGRGPAGRDPDRR